MIPKQLIDSCQILVNDGVKALNIPVGVVSHIYNNLYEIVSINSAMGRLTGGTVFPLEKTFCGDVYRTDKMIAVTEVNNVHGQRLHPLYVRISVQAYIGAPIHHNGVVWGTVNFTSSTHHAPFTRADMKCVREYATKISGWLHDIDMISRAPWDV